MTQSIPHTTRRVKSPAPARLTECQTIQRPICCCEILPKGLAGCVSINGQLYLVSYHADVPEQGEVIVRGYRLVSPAGEVYDLSPETGCECKDHEYRRRACKHILAITKLVERGDLLEVTPAYPVSF